MHGGDMHLLPGAGVASSLLFRTLQVSVGLLCLCFAVITTLNFVLWRLRVRTAPYAAELWRERRMREELEAYARLDPSLTGELGTPPAAAQRELSKRICRTVAEKSVFSRVAMLLRDPEGRFVCVGSVGVDDLTVAALHAWAEEERGAGGVAHRRVEAGARSFSIALGEWSQFDPEVATWAASGQKERRRWRRAILAPIRTRSGRIVGALAVCADGPRGMGEHLAQQESRHRKHFVPAHQKFPQNPERAMGAIESLAARLAAALEHEALSERLLRAEKLAGLGQLAGGVAHALNNPLTAVLGFAELIVETAGEPRIRQDANTILLEAHKMKDTVARLIEFWRPTKLSEDSVDLHLLVSELALLCSDKLKSRGVDLVLSSPHPLPPIRGSADRLREVLEHLLNNAAQSIAGARPREANEGGHAIRVTVSHDARAAHIIVSDTGPGFLEPSRVFDPFYTTREPGEGDGLGLSTCFGIIREHGGEISAFNLHPHGAAVVVELPLRQIIQAEDQADDMGPDEVHAEEGQVAYRSPPVLIRRADKA